VFAPYGKKVAELARVGSCDAPFEDMPQTDVRISIDTAQPQARVYPLLLKVSEGKRGRQPRVHTVTVPFDTKKFRYQVPKNLEEGGC
jgi:hypothetical protein